MVSENQPDVNNIEELKPTRNTPTPYRLGDLLGEFDAYAEKLDKARETGIPFGPTSGIDAIDRQLCGSYSPGLHVVMGNTGSGKTAFCLQTACNCGCPALYVSCEMSALELLRRIAARVNEIPLEKFKDPKFALAGKMLKVYARKAVESAPQLVIADATKVFATPEWIRDQAEIIKDTWESERLLIVIDSLNAWTDYLPGEEYERLNFGLAQLRIISSELDCPIIYIAEQNRESNKQHEKAGANSGAGSRRIEYGGESVMGLYADLNDDKQPVINAFGQTPVTLRFHKNRNGAAAKPIKLLFTGKFMSFTEDK